MRSGDQDEILGGRACRVAGVCVGLGRRMCELERAELVLASARARSTRIVVPGSATSPMDELPTLTIPRALIAACDPLTHQPVRERPRQAFREDGQAQGAIFDRAIFDRASFAPASFDPAGFDPALLDAEMHRTASGLLKDERTDRATERNSA